MSLESTVTYASPKTKSLRATVPGGIVAFLGLKAKDKVNWLMEVDENGVRFVKVWKAKK